MWSDEGCGKSTMLNELLPLELQEYFTDNINLSDAEKDLRDKVAGMVLVELSEESFAQRPAKMKVFFSARNAYGRDSYGYHAKDHLRTHFPIATGNEEDFLKRIEGLSRRIHRSRQ